MPTGKVAPGDTIAGKYRLVRTLGEGGMATIFEGRHLKLAQRVAIKVLAAEFLHDGEIVERFEREARALSVLKTPRVARVIDVDEMESGLPYIVMEFLEGHDLEVELASRKRYSIPEAVDLVIQAASAMMEVHANGIVHRDLKPGNILVTKVDGKAFAKIIDFGISKVETGGKRLTAAGAVMGTVLYMPPEQIKAAGDVDLRADIWSLGVILFEMVAGRPPWAGSNAVIASSIVSNEPPDIRTFLEVPGAFATTLKKLLARNPDQRPQSMREVIEELSEFTNRDTTVAGEILDDLGIQDPTETKPNNKMKFTLPMPTKMNPGFGIRVPPMTPEEHRQSTLPLNVKALLPNHAAQPIPAPAPAKPASKALPIALLVLFALAVIGVALIVLSRR